MHSVALAPSQDAQVAWQGTQRLPLTKKRCAGQGAQVPSAKRWSPVLQVAQFVDRPPRQVAQEAWQAAHLSWAVLKSPSPAQGPQVPSGRR